MNDIDQELFTFIANRKSILALLSADGTVNACRIFPDQAPQSAVFPRVTFNCVSSVGETHMGGSTPLQHDNWQMSVWAGSASSRKAVSNALRNELHCAQGFDMGDVHVSSCKLTNEYTGAVDEDAANDEPILANHMNFSIWYTRPETAHTL